MSCSLQSFGICANSIGRPRSSFRRVCDCAPNLSTCPATFRYPCGALLRLRQRILRHGARGLGSTAESSLAPCSPTRHSGYVSRATRSAALTYNLGSAQAWAQPKALRATHPTVPRDQRRRPSHCYRYRHCLSYPSCSGGRRDLRRSHCHRR